MRLREGVCTVSESVGPAAVLASALVEKNDDATSGGGSKCDL